MTSVTDPSELPCLELPALGIYCLDLDKMDHGKMYSEKEGRKCLAYVHLRCWNDQMLDVLGRNLDHRFEVSKLRIPPPIPDMNMR